MHKKDNTYKFVFAVFSIALCVLLLLLTKCSVCKKKYAANPFDFGGKKYCESCTPPVVLCDKCKGVCSGDYTIYQDKNYCKNCSDNNKKICRTCGIKLFAPKNVQIFNEYSCADCFVKDYVCNSCQGTLKPGEYDCVDGYVYCPSCYREKRRVYSLYPVAADGQVCERNPVCDSSNIGDGSSLCSSCRSRYYVCAGCRRALQNDVYKKTSRPNQPNRGSYYCRDCYEEKNYLENREWRRYQGKNGDEDAHFACSLCNGNTSGKLLSYWDVPICGSCRNERSNQDDWFCFRCKKEIQTPYMHYIDRHGIYYFLCISCLTPAEIDACSNYQWVAGNYKQLMSKGDTYKQKLVYYVKKRVTLREVHSGVCGRCKKHFSVITDVRPEALPNEIILCPNCEKHT